VRDALSSGHFAVSFFFVLSGFVLLWPAALAGHGVGDLRAYARRRAARILPAYYVVLALGAALFGLLVVEDSLADRVSPGSLVAHLLLLHNEARLLPGYDGALGLGVNPALWTLSVEWVFYCALPLVAAPFVKRPLAFAAVAVAVAVAGRALLETVTLSSRTEALLLSSAPMHAVDFAAGMAVACLIARRPERVGSVPRAAWVAAGAAVAVLVLMAVAGGPDGSDAREAARTDVLLAVGVPGTFAALVAALVLAPAGPLASRPTRWLGTVSFGVFLSHFLFIGFARATLGLPVDGTTRAFLAMEAFVLVGACLYGWLSWTVVEAPARRWARSAGDVRGEVLRVSDPLAARAGDLDQR
jgi:peptidoglycan/LPS O-acetylase OafA/YrhL